MRHRGPDDAGTWWSEDSTVGLAHRRLSIIDLTSGGHQPMRHEADGLTLVFNGEIYNFVELREELIALGHHFNSGSDTEVLLEAYRAWDCDCLNRLDGMFAFCLYDGPRKRLFLARDRAGEKPLFLWHRNGEFRFASELKALLADPQFPRSIDTEALEEYLAYGYVCGSKCILKDVAKLPQGSAAIYDPQGDRLRTWRYWSLPDRPPPTRGDAEELTARFETLLAESVQRRMVADVPVGILLSGGIDSGLVTALAARASSRPVKTFTVTFPEHQAHDEAARAKLVADHFGTIHTELRAEQASVGLLDELAGQFDEPIGDSSMVPTFLVSQLIREHATVALGGDGGDELFGGYHAHGRILRAARIRKFFPRPLRRALGWAVARTVPVGRFGRTSMLTVLSDLPESIARISLLFDAFYRPTLLANPGENRTDRASGGPEAIRIQHQQAYSTPLQKVTATDFRTYLPDDILVKVDRASMLASLEVRSPFLSHRVVEFAFRAVPDSLRATTKRSKILPKLLAEKLLPAGLDFGRKQGFALPMQQWFRGQWGQYCREVLSQADPTIFSRNAIDRLIRQQERGYYHTHRLFALTMFELWRRRYNVSM